MVDNDIAALDPVEAMPDGVSLAQWSGQHHVGRTAAFAFLRILRSRGLEPEKLRSVGASRPSPYLSGKVLEAMDGLLQEHRAGKSVAAIEAEFTAAIVTASPLTADEDDDHFNSEDLIRRLTAANLAITTGLPLSRPELDWILGTPPMNPVARKARIGIEQRSLRGWTLLAPQVD